MFLQWRISLLFFLSARDDIPEHRQFVLLEDFYSFSNVIRIDVEPAEQFIIFSPQELGSRGHEAMMVGFQDSVPNPVRCPANEEEDDEKNDPKRCHLQAGSDY